MEAEYRGAVVAACEAVWLKRILKDLGVSIMDPIRIFYDNMGSIYLARNPMFHARTKHILVHYHFIRERMQAGEIDLQHISMNLQVVDIFTKASGDDKLGKFASGLGLTTWEPRVHEGKEEEEKEDTNPIHQTSKSQTVSIDTNSNINFRRHLSRSLDKLSNELS